MAKQYIQCPKCRHTSTVGQWDEQTKKDYGIKEGAVYMSCGDDKEELKRVEAMFVCPICEEEVPGVELVSDNDIVPN